eukprot:UN14508
MRTLEQADQTLSEIQVRQSESNVFSEAFSEENEKEEDDILSDDPSVYHEELDGLLKSLQEVVVELNKPVFN